MYSICLTFVDGHLEFLELVNTAKSPTQNIIPATLWKFLCTMSKPNTNCIIGQFVRNLCVKKVRTFDIYTTNVAVKWLELVLHIPGVPNSHLGVELGLLFLVVFLSPSRQVPV